MRRTLICSLLPLWLALTSAAAEKPKLQGVDYFEKHVRPLLIEKCFSCHAAKKQRGGLRVDSHAALLKGGDTGRAIIPGKPDESLLIKAVRYIDEDLQMPPKGRLEDEQVAALEQWVRIGAPWPAEAAAKPALGDQKQIEKAAAKHWAFQPMQKGTPPKVKGAILNPVDAFVLARLEAAGLTMAKQADPRALIRRTYFALIGLPPSPEEVAQFRRAMATDPKKAMSDIVDRLLESKHYGERWARHWLDIARYADTRDWFPQIDTRYPYAYTYRDWVTNALNADLPYDRFLRLQIAADFHVKDKGFADLAAMGFLTVGPRFRNRQLDQAADRIDVVTRGLMGLTVTCARCHDHKYDPIPTKDYYSLYGVFASSETPESFPIIAGRTVSPAMARDYEAKRAVKQAALARYRKGLQQTALKEFHQRIEEYLLGFYDMGIAKKASIRSLISKRKLKETAMTPLARSLGFVSTRAVWHRHPVLGPWSILMKGTDQQVKNRMRLALAVRNLNPLVREMLTTNPPKTKKEVILAYAKLMTRAQKAGSKAPPALKAIYDLLHQKDGPFMLQENDVVQASRLLGQGRIKLARFQNAIQQVDLTHPGAPARAMTLVDKDKPVNPMVFIRGEPRRRGDRVPRRFLKIIEGEDRKPFTDGSGRRELADAIAHPKNPLTARVLVNRVWMHHFGEGLVSTPGDFGLRAEPPSHPQLLDWLAVTFIDNGWSLKKLHRMILLSRAWQQSSDPKAEQLAKAERVDPDNQLLWKFNRRRLDFEAMRDAILVSSGQLNRKIGGRPVKLTERPYSTRRTIYGFVDRVNLDDIYTTFDFPSPDQSSPQRPETMVPQQALFGLNHPFMVQQARKLTDLPEMLKLQTDEKKLQFLYQRLYGRNPTPEEVTLTKSFLTDVSEGSTKSGAIWQYGYGPVEPEEGEMRFHPLRVFTGRKYQGGKDFPDRRLGHISLTMVGGHPGRDLNHAVIRRWTAPCDGVVSIEGTLEHLRNKGDGIQGRAIANGKVIGTWKVFNRAEVINIPRVKIKAGEPIDFVVDCRAHTTSDAFRWAPTIKLIEGFTPGKRSWDAKRDFAAPPPPPLSSWGQIAQALFLTNEFMFVD